MAKKIVPDELKRERVSISMPKYLADKLKSNKNYSHIVVKLLIEYFNKVEK